jgi:hypothetical protein
MGEGNWAGMAAPLSFCGRTFTAEELELLRQIAQDSAGLAVTASTARSSASAGTHWPNMPDCFAYGTSFERPD